MQAEYLFVYGTLLEEHNGFGKHLRQHCSFVTKATLNGRLYDAGDYPALITGGYSIVHGSIYILDAATVLEQIDAYEGYGENEEKPNLYLRKKLVVQTSEGPRQAWAYVYNRSVEGMPFIASGDYLEYILQKKSPGFKKPGDTKL